MPEQIVVKSSAIFIADSHENENRENFWHFLCALKSGEIKTPQLFLMGDMFDFLASECEFFVKFYERYVRAIDELGEKMEIYYFEGNHDFNLAPLFKNVKAYPIGAQPVKFASECGQSVLIAHGVEAKMRRYNAFYEADVVIEGHYHQGEQYTIGKQKYINISSFACEQSYFVVEYGQNIKFARKSVKV